VRHGPFAIRIRAWPVALKTARGRYKSDVRNYRLFVALVSALVVIPSAAASDRLALNASRVTLAVSADGKTAVVTYRSRGALHHALVSGAVNALPPTQTVPQVRFKIDWTGGWATHRNGRWWQRLGDHCSAYDGPQLTALVAACRAPDGSYWALQSWQPRLPHRGYPPYLSGQTDWELDVSHWTSPLAELEVHADWAFNGQAHNLFGSLLYNGVPVHGFHTVKGTGAPQDRYGRSLYINTFDSAYGRGWKRETSIVFRNPTGVFCYSFWPTHDVSLPSSPARPAGNGNRYRINVVGPGVTPDVVAETADPGVWDKHDAAKVEWERRQLKLFDAVTAGDKFCATQR
jgi:hypothetical protein